MTATTGTARPGDLRNAMVNRLTAAGRVSRPEVERALRTVPRHLFVPAAPLNAAYADDTVTIKPGPDGGRPMSCISQPTVVATMLDQAALQEGDNVLEIGGGTGYTSALISEIVGSSGKVTTVDIDPDVAAHARGALASADYGMVNVVRGDGAHGQAASAPYDAIIVSVGPWDLPSPWSDQLVDGGTLVVPLGWRGQSRSVVFHKVDGHLRAVDSAQCGFIPMQGPGQNGERTGPIADDVTLHGDRDQNIDLGALTLSMAIDGVAVWSETTIAPEESTDPVWLRLTGTEPGTCRLAASAKARDTGVCNPAFLHRNPAVVEGTSIAYLSVRESAADGSGVRRYELGATGHGPEGAELAERMCRQIRTWGHNRTEHPIISAYPANTPDNRMMPGTIIDKSCIRLVITY